MLELEGKDQFELLQELASKDNELLTETGKVRIEMKARITKLEGERQTQAELYDTINTLEKQLSGERSTRRAQAFRAEGSEFECQPSQTQ